MVVCFGVLPDEGQTLLGVAARRACAKRMSHREVVDQGKFVRLSPMNLPESKQLKLARMYPWSLYKSASSTVLVALPKSSAWNPSESTAPIVDTSILAWVTLVVTDFAQTSQGCSERKTLFVLRPYQPPYFPLVVRNLFHPHPLFS